MSPKVSKSACDGHKCLDRCFDERLVVLVRVPPASEKRLAVTCVMVEVALMASAFLMTVPVMVKFRVEWSSDVMI